MKLNNAQIIQNMDILRKYNEKYYPQKISFAIVKNYNIYKKEYDLYLDSLQKMMKSYEEHFVKDENGKPKVGATGIPEVETSYREEYINELNELLSCEVEINPYLISEDLFDYDGDKYDVMSPMDVSILMGLLCK